MKKYELITVPGSSLFRIKALRSFSSIQTGDLGGYLESEANLSHDGDCWVSGSAEVSGSAQVYGYARVSGDARVSGYAEVSGSAQVYGYARVYGYAEVSGSAQVYGYARVYGSARVSGSAEVSGDARVYGSARVYGYARVYGSLIITGPITTINRSDGYTFLLAKDTQGTPIITAGCRYFTVPEAYEHWTKTRGGTPLGDETIDILDFLVKRAKI